MKNIIFLIVGVAATLGIISATAVTNQVFATSDLPECTDGTGQPPGNPCIETSTETESENPGLDKETTTVTKKTCSSGNDGNCRGQGQGRTQESEVISEDCSYTAKNARQGEGQTTGRTGC